MSSWFLHNFQIFLEKLLMLFYVSVNSCLFFGSSENIEIIQEIVQEPDHK
jgi:hypothetical protein